MLKIRRSRDRLIFNMGIPIPGKDGLYIETVPRIVARAMTFARHAPLTQSWMVIGIDHDTVCAGVVGTAIRHSTSYACRCAVACARAGRHNEYQPRQRSADCVSGQFLFYHDHYFIKSKENLRFRRLVPLFVPN